MVKRGLGKGFASLIPTDVLDSKFDTTANEDEKVSSLRLIPIDKISPDPNQPRNQFDDKQIDELAESIKQHGLLQPIVVTPKRNGRFEIVAGERRYRAAKLAGLQNLTAIVRTLSAQHKLEISIIENVQRKDLNVLETATAYAKLKNQFNLSDSQIASRLGKATSTIANQIRLLGLPKEAKEELLNNNIVEGHARQILAIKDKKIQKQLLNLIIKNNWTVRKAEQFVIGYKASLNQAKVSGDHLAVAKRATRTETELTKKLAKKLGFNSKSIKQKTTAHGGEIIIKYNSDDEVKKLASIFGVN